MGASAVGSAIGAGSSIIGGGKANKSANKAEKKAAQAQADAAMQQEVWNRQNQQWAQGANRENATWLQGINQPLIQQQLAANRADQSNAFNTLDWNQDPTTGAWNQTSTMNPGDQATLDALRAKSPELISGMGSGFDVNGDVMNSIRALQAPEIQANEDATNARLAAMGLGTSSGKAWQDAQQTLGDTRSRADLSAIMQGFNANQAIQQGNRQDLGVLNQAAQGLHNNLAMPGYANQGISTATLPGMSPNVSGYQDPTYAQAAGQLAGAQTQQGWNQIGQAAQSATPGVLEWLGLGQSQGQRLGTPAAGTTLWGGTSS
jgi:hypothetical protein